MTTQYGACFKYHMVDTNVMVIIQAIGMIIFIYGYVKIKIKHGNVLNGPSAKVLKVIVSLELVYFVLNITLKIYGWINKTNDE